MARKIEQLDVLKEGCAERLRIARELTELSQTEYAKQARIAPNTYNQYEKAQRLPDLLASIALCKTYGLTLDWIYRGSARGLDYDFILKLKKLGVQTDTDE